MRQITRKAVEALLVGAIYKNSNTEVRNNAMYLHGHKIAWFDINNQLWIHHCGYRTRTTRDRLVALPNVHIVQRQGTWYLNGEPWTDGQPKRIGRVL